MFNENYSWIPRNKYPEGEYLKNDYHNLHFVDTVTKDCLKQNPLPREKFEVCKSQFDRTFSQVFWDKFMISVPEVVEKMATVDTATQKRIIDLFSKSMMS